MSEQDWTVSPDPQPTFRDQKHKATVEGLEAVVEERRGSTSWQVNGYLADVQIIAGGFGGGWKRPIDEAKAQATAAARRLYAAGVRGAISYPVECCDRLFVTRDAADQHEGEHVEEKANPRYIVEMDPDTGPTYFITDTRPEHLDLPPGEKAIVFSTTNEAVANQDCARLNRGGSLADLEDAAGAEEVPYRGQDMVSYDQPAPGPEEVDSEHAARVLISPTAGEELARADREREAGASEVQS